MAENNELVASPSAALPLPLYRHLRHRSVGSRVRRVMWISLITFAFVNGLFFAYFPLALLPVLLLPLVLLAALVIWAAPRTAKPPLKSLTVLYFAFFVSLIIWPNYLAISIPGLPWITLIRLFGFPMAVLLLFCLSQSPEFRVQLREALRTTPWVWRLLVAFICIQFLTIPFSSHPFSSLSKFVIAQVNWTMIFFVSCFVFQGRRRVLQWTFLMVVMALFVIAIGTWEWRMQHVPWAGHIPRFMAVSDESVQRILAGATRLGVFYRTQSTFTTSLSFAEYLALTAPFVIHLAVEGRRLITRIAAAACVPIIFFGVFITNSRLGALGFFLSFLLYIIVWAFRRWRSDTTSILGPAITLGYPLIFGSFVAASLVNLRLYRLVWGGGQYQFSTDARRQQIEMGLPKILHAPWGHGIGQAGEVLGFTNPSGLLTIDNYYLSIALEYGVVGFIAYYGMFIIAIAYAGLTVLRSRSYETSFLMPAMIALCNFVVIKSVLSQEANHPLAFMLLGMITALVYRVGRENAPSSEVASPIEREEHSRRESLRT